MIERLDALEAEAARAMDAARDPGTLEVARVRWLGRKSELTRILRGLKDLTPAERSSVGARANRLRESLERRYDEVRARLEQDGAEHGAPSGPDLTLPGRAIPRGHAVDGLNLKTLLSGSTDSHRSQTFLMHYPHAPHRSTPASRYFRATRLVRRSGSLNSARRRAVCAFVMIAGHAAFPTISLWCSRCPLRRAPRSI